MNRYREMKEKIRAQAMEWLHDSTEAIYSWETLEIIQEYFRKQGKRYGLLKEFMENGIC